MSVVEWLGIGGGSVTFDSLIPSSKNECNFALNLGGGGATVSPLQKKKKSKSCQVIIIFGSETAKPVINAPCDV